MAFMMKKKKYRFNVEVQLQDLDNVALVNEVLFAKIRLLDGGSFQEYSSRKEVRNHRVEWNRNFTFPCKMSANASTGVLDPCYLRISIRKEMKGGRSYYKLGFIDLNLAEYAGAGLISRRCLLEGYDARHRLDNSMLTVSIKMHMLSGDILFKAPTPNLKSKQKPSTEDLAAISTEVKNIASAVVSVSLPTAGSSSVISSNIMGGRPISSIRDEEIDPQVLIASLITDSGLSESSESAVTLTSDALLLQQHQMQEQQHQLHQQTSTLSSSYPPSSVASLIPGVSLTNAQQLMSPYGGIGGTGGNGGGGGNLGGIVIGSNNYGTTTVISTTGSAVAPTSIMEMGHSRNSSNTSQMSKGSGYSSFSHSQHSRQSSEGDSGHARFRKSVSLLNRLNQKAMNAMKLHIPALKHNNAPTSQSSQQQQKLQVSKVINECESEELLFQTPNSSICDDSSALEEFRTPLNEIPSSDSSLTAPCPYSMTFLNTPSPTYRSINGSSRSESRDSQLYESESDSGLDENFHTPRVVKIKSMENVSLLKMEFHKASQELDRDSPRRLKLLADRERLHLPKMKSLNNLSLENYIEKELREEFQRIKDESNEDRKSNALVQERKNSTSSASSGKLYVKSAKVGNAKFIGNDDSPLPLTLKKPTTQILENFHYPIQKMRSLGTIPDVVGEHIAPDPFLTPTSIRKPQFPCGTQSAEKTNSPSYPACHFAFNTVDANNLQHYSHNSLNKLYCQDRLGKLMLSTENNLLSMSRTLERAYRRNLMKSSTPLRQTLGFVQYGEPFYTLRTEDAAVVSHIRPQSISATYDLMRNSKLHFVAYVVRKYKAVAHICFFFNQRLSRIVNRRFSERDCGGINYLWQFVRRNRNFSGVSRRLLDGGSSAICGGVSRQLSATGASSSTSHNTNTTNPLFNSSSPYGTMNSNKSSHSTTSSNASSSASSNNVVTCQCTSMGSDTVDDVAGGNYHHQQQIQQQLQQNSQNSAASPADGSRDSAICGNESFTLSHNNNGGGSTPRIGEVALAASPTDACSIRSNPSSGSLMVAADAAGLSAAGHSVGSNATSVGGSTLSPISSGSHLIRRPSITMNPSSGSLVISETGSLDRMKTTAEKRKKGPLDDGPRVSDRVEETRVNPKSLIDEILKDDDLDQLEESTETSGLQLYIARDGTAALGNHEVKSRVSAGAFKQVVMENPR
ncbi:LOW QUALITY PROTEIN: uncharacterized protein ACN2A1_015225 [Glossina fuscipes fuscipes]